MAGTRSRGLIQLQAHSHSTTILLESRESTGTPVSQWTTCRQWTASSYWRNRNRPVKRETGWEMNWRDQFWNGCLRICCVMGSRSLTTLRQTSTIQWLPPASSAFHRQLNHVVVKDVRMVRGQRQRLKPGFHYPSSRPEFTGRVDGCQKCTRVDGPSTRPVNSGSGNRALWPEEWIKTWVRG